MKFFARALVATGLLASAGASAEPPASADPCAGAPPAATSPPAMRRLYLVRHGEANYLGADGQRIANPDLAGLSDRGRSQAQATARWFCAMGIRTFDVVYTSPFTRARQTTATVLDTMHLPASLVRVAPDLREQDPDHETISQARARMMPALEALRGEPWRTALIVAHSQVDKLLLSEMLTGSESLVGRLEQGNGCINVIDAGEGPRDWIVRAMNVCPAEGGIRY